MSIVGLGRLTRLVSATLALAPLAGGSALWRSALWRSVSSPLLGLSSRLGQDPLLAAASWLLLAAGVSRLLAAFEVAGCASAQDVFSDSSLAA